jgi:predicted  nucleic acid-binding Zn-ribbon protein
MIFLFKYNFKSFCFQDKYESLNQESNHTDQQYLNIDHEISIRTDKQIEWDRKLTSLTNDMHLNDENIRDKQSTIEFLENELRQKQQDLNQLIQIDQDKTNIYAPWMSDCLKTIQNDQRFYKKPIGPISNIFF